MTETDSAAASADHPRLRALVCDHDALVRSVVGGYLQRLGHHVIAEIGDSYGMNNAVESMQIDLLVVDLTMTSGDGPSFVRWLVERQPSARIVVFAASVAGSHQPLLDAGAAAVVDKPDFEELEHVLSTSSDEEPVAPVKNRRAEPRPVALPEPTFTGPWGLEPWEAFTNLIDRLTIGDAILALDVVGLRLGDPTFHAAHRLEVARLVSQVRRSHDRLAVDSFGRPFVFVVAGQPQAPIALFDRVVTAWGDLGLLGRVVGAFTHVRDGQPRGSLQQTIELIRQQTENPTTDLRVG